MRLRDIGWRSTRTLLADYGLRLEMVADGQPIPGSYWGDSEAGLIGTTVYARADTPIHSVLHEAGHAICMGDARRRTLHTDARSDQDEEMAVCYLQALLAPQVAGYSRRQLFADMDAWGYGFVMDHAAAWFEHDARDARSWLVREALIDDDDRPLGQAIPPASA